VGITKGTVFEMLDLLLDPNVAYVLLMAGFVMAVLALISPGTGFMEIIALFILALAGFSMFRLPIHFWALALIVVSVIPFVISLRWVRHWALLLVSLAGISAGAIFLFRTENGAPAINPLLAVVVTVSALMVLWIVGRRSMEAVQRAPAFDMQHLIGQTGEARNDFTDEGTVYVMGEEWTARANRPVRQGSRIRVTGREGLVLLVEEEINQTGEISDPTIQSL
jgi:membrane-bound serine protease (ClpP class)